ncbi:hypothetical protein CASFOL_031691 [Castilleja foliolosa]|uniref:Wax synthase domain-containing protein n=1 Tax=Castilleja foliolosa TaxID=1961234 RepID=A0ABD3C691_9LAMI
MEGEIKNLFLVWSTVLASLCYCHTISKLIPTGNNNNLKPLLISPIICLFLVLPQNLTSIHLGGTTSFFISWLANFKLILFAFNKGPLSSNPPIPLTKFIPLACFPIKLQNPKSTISKRPSKSTLNYVIKIAFLAAVMRIYNYKDQIHPHIVLFFYCLHIYFMLEMGLALFAFVAKSLLRVELEPQFDEPYLATSLQDFWGRRWNMMVSNILKPTVYGPVKSLSARLISGQWAPIPAVLATFVVSGLMHELVFYNIGRLRPTGEVMGFFVIQGLSLSFEIVVKKVLDGKFMGPGFVSRPLTLVYVMYTSFWLFFPPFLRGKAEFKACTETLAFVEFVKTRRLVGPSDMSCPFL